MLRRLLLPPAAVLLCLGILLPIQLHSASQITRGTIDGAHFAIATPADREWNHQILLIAHGYRPESAPLVADLFPDQLAYRTLLDEGWIIAKTSYHRNGIIVADAITDLDNLRAHLASLYGSPRKVLLTGDSMGGTIATHLAERGGDLYDGLIAIGAALDLHEPHGAVGITLQPRLPLLFIANRSEIAGPRDYLAHAIPRFSRAFPFSH
ncbi:MAG: alpha/beta hydrolase [Candidatus Synoicihabitans palmerolidicus]|nr:alpha/beta hydrolase [Candidatus Synoicihabitans palmerolidicus]